MGLDMYVRGITEIENAPSHGCLDYDAMEADGAEVFELKYWRKFNNLHGWMERLYADKGGTEQFNCQSVRLTLEDLARLEREVLEEPGAFAPTPGFLFGSQEDLTLEDKTNIIEFVGRARAFLWLNPDGAVYYDSWW